VPIYQFESAQLTVSAKQTTSVVPPTLAPFSEVNAVAMDKIGEQLTTIPDDPADIFFEFRGNRIIDVANLSDAARDACHVLEESINDRRIVPLGDTYSIAVETSHSPAWRPLGGGRHEIVGWLLRQQNGVTTPWEFAVDLNDGGEFIAYPGVSIVLHELDELEL